MACFTERPLKDAESNKFLQSKGFSLRPSCSHSTWRNGNIELVFELNEPIRNDEQFYNIIQTMAWKKGLADGKQESLEKLQSLLRNAICPPIPIEGPIRTDMAPVPITINSREIKVYSDALSYKQIIQMGHQQYREDYVMTATNPKTDMNISVFPNSFVKIEPGMIFRFYLKDVC